MNAHPTFAQSDERAFKQSFAIQFLASYAAANYDRSCAEGDNDRLSKLPVEDADFIARDAWEHWKTTNGVRSIDWSK